MATGGNADVERDWTPSRLIPVAGIRGQSEQEARATSALLAVVSAVPSFADTLRKVMGARAGKIRTFTEVRLKGSDGKTHIPDGVIAVERGSYRWSCLVEIKTASVALDADQVVRYLDMARQHGFDGVLTISNQFVADPDALPYKVKGSKIAKLTVRHMSWWQVLTEAVIQHRFRGVDDPDQAWILNELIRYLTNENSGASGLEGMGPEWVAVRDGARNGTVSTSDPETKGIAARWEHLIEFLCLNLSQELGVIVRRNRVHGKSSADRLSEGIQRLANEGELHSAIQVPKAVGPIDILANLRTRQVTTSVSLDAPRDLKRPTARINWLLRQLKDAPDALRIDVRFAHVRETRSELLGDCRESPACLLLPSDEKREPRAFVLAMTQPMGKKGGRGGGSFIDDLCKQAISFYRDLVQDLRPPQPKAPKLAEDETTPKPEPEQSEGQVRREQDSSRRTLAELLGYGVS